MAKESDYLVLVVDDEEDILAFLTAALEDAGFRVVTARNGKEALEAVRRERPDFISLDLVMPGGSGIWFLHELRRNRDWAKIPVMMVTGHAQDDLGRADLQTALEGRLLSGPNAYLEKPVTAERYVQAVRQALGIASESQPSVEAPQTLEEARRLLEQADPDTLKAVVDLLKRTNKD